MDGWKIVVCGVGLLGLGAAAPALAEIAGERRPLTLLVTSGLSGRLVEEDGATIAGLVSTVRRETDAARRDGREVVVLDAGRTLVPYAESRFDGGRMMSRVLEAAGCAVFAPSAIDLSLGRDRLEELASVASFPVLRPFTGGGDDGLAAAAVLELGRGLTLQVADLFDPLFAGELEDYGVSDTAPRGPRSAFEGLDAAGALRVAVLHSKLHSEHLERRGLTWGLIEEPHGIDLVINPDLGHDLTLSRETGEGPVALAGFRLVDERPWTLRRLDLELERRGEGWVVGAAASRALAFEAAAPAEAALEREVRDAFARFREAYSDPLPDAAPADRPGLARFVLAAVRETARAEVVALSRGALRPVHPSHFEQAPLAREAVMRLLSLDLQIGVVALSGDDLAALARESVRRRHPDGEPRKDSLVFAGLDVELVGEGANAAVGRIEVNGRELHEEDRYRVATSTYLLSGGDNYPLLAGLEAEVVAAPGRPGQRAELRRDVVLPRLERAGEPFVDLRRRGVWRFGLDELGVSFDGVETRRDEAYADVPDSRANAVDSSSARSRLRLRVDQEFVGWSWENRLRASFGLLDTEGAERREVDDELQLESSLVFSRRRFLGGEPYLSLILDSELRRSPGPGGVRRPRQLEQALAGGLEWSRRNWRRLRLGVVGRHYSNSVLSDRLGFELEGHYRLRPRGRRPGFEGLLFFDSLRDGGESLERTDLEVRLLVPAWGELELTPAFNYYNYRDSELPGSADYYRLSLGFSYTWAGKYQDLD